jgi:hypothetical protein
VAGRVSPAQAGYSTVDNQKFEKSERFFKSARKIRKNLRASA